MNSDIFFEKPYVPFNKSKKTFFVNQGHLCEIQTMVGDLQVLISL